MTKLIPGENDLATTCPDLAAEWHPTKNDELLPRSITSGSSRKVWWLGSCGHEWQAVVGNRANGTGCPYCAGVKLLQGFNDLATVRPDLAAEWHPTKNGDLSPFNVSPHSNKKVWWQCSEGHEWQASVSGRSSGLGCPICSGHKILPGYNDLATTRPDLAAEWNTEKNGEFTPQKATIGCNKKVWWKCENGHEWQATVVNRTKPTGCPYCTGRIAIVGENDLVTTHPKIAAEWHPTKNGDLQPSDVKAQSNKKVWWKCENGHEWESLVYSRTNGRGCPICAHELHVSFPEKALLFYISCVFSDTVASQHFEWLGQSELDIYIPSLRTAVEYDGQAWHQDTQRDILKNQLCVEHDVRLIRIREPKCPIIPGECIVLASLKQKDLTASITSLFQDFLKTDYDIRVDVERDRFRIYELLEYTKKELSLASMHPEIATEWHPTRNGELTPEHIMSASHKKAWWICDKGHEWEMKVSNRTALKQGCPVCANQKVLAGYNDLATIQPELAAEWHPTKNGGLTPDKVIPGTTKKVWWLGKCGHEWDMPINKRTQRGHNCPYCSNHRLLPGFNDLATVRPDIAVQWHPTKNGDLAPEQVTPGSDTRVWWICAEGHEWEAMVSKRNAGRGCPICARRRTRK